MMIETPLAVAKAISEPRDFGGSILGFQRAAAFMTGVFTSGFGVVAGCS